MNKRNHEVSEELLASLLANYKKPEDLIGENGLLKQLTKLLVEKALDAEMTEHLGHDRHEPVVNLTANASNGRSRKTLKGEFGELPIAVPRDRQGSFEPQLIPKHQTRWAGFDDAILERLVVLNAERAAEEARGHIRWLRPEFQNPQATPAPQQVELAANTGEVEDTPTPIAPAASKPIPWPKDTIEQVRAVADLLAASPVPLSVEEIAARFTARGPWKKRLPQLVEMLVALGRAKKRGSGVVGMGR